MALSFKPYGGLEGLLLVEGPAFPDDRGLFFESWRSDEWSAAGLPPLLQDNLSRSRKGVVRGLHYQAPPRPVGKLVRCAQGRVYDVAVDVRRGSPTFGRHAAVELAGDSHRALWVPAGFAHGFCALTDDAVVAYKVTDYWAKEVDRGVLWNDPALAIPWPLPPGGALVSPKDAVLPPLSRVEPF